MKLINYTKVPDDLLRQMIRFCVPSGVHGFDISFKNSGDGFLSGYAYHSGTCYHKRDGKIPPLITISVPKWFGSKPGVNRSECIRGRSHHGNPRRALCRERQEARGYMVPEVFTNHERLLHIIAHELRHLWQRKVRKGRRVWAGRGRYSERDADAYAIHMTRMWRRA